MYEAFYHLNSNPFRLTPDPKFCFSHAGYKSAREYLDYALRLGEGFIMVTGRPGTGKTTLAEAFLKDLDPTRVLAERIAVSGLDANELLRAVAFAYGIEANGFDKATLRHRIQQRFILQEQHGRRALLIIDEAQGLPSSSLEELRLLADLQAGPRPLLQLFLVGQETLRDLMRTPGMDQFQQRIIATCHLKPLGLQETRAYIQHRLYRAGWKGDPELTGAALFAIHQSTRGVPRHINKLCNRLLVLGYGKGKHILDEEEVRTISVELREEQLTPLGVTRETPDESGTTRPGEETGDEAVSLPELALDRNCVEVGNPHLSVAPAPAPRPDMHAATRQTRQTAAWRIEARAKTRREGRPVKKSEPRRNRISTLDKMHQRYGSGLVRLFNRRDRMKIGMAWGGVAALVVATLTTASENTVFLLSVGLIGFFLLRKANEGSVSAPDRGRQRYGSGLVRHFNRLDRMKVGMACGVAALVVATLSTGGLGRFSGERTDRATLPDEQRALIKPSMLAHGGDQATTEMMIPQTGQQGPATRRQAAIPAETPEKPPANGNRIQVGRNAAVVQAATPVQMPEDISIAAAPAVDPPPVESVTPPEQVSETTQDGLQINGFTARQDELAMASAPDTVVTDFGSMEAPAAGDGADQMVSAEDQRVAPPVSREDKIAALLTRGQQSLKQFRLLTPAGDNANHYFKEVLALDPGNSVARDGINQIVERYALLARRADARHDRKLAKVYISRGLQVLPGNRALLALQDSMLKPPVTTLETVAMAPPAFEPPPPQASLFSRLKALFTWAREEPAPVVERSIASLNH